MKNLSEAVSETLTSQFFKGIMILGGGMLGFLYLGSELHLISGAVMLAGIKLSILIGSFETFTGLYKDFRQDDRMLGVSDVKQIEMK